MHCPQCLTEYRDGFFVCEDRPGGACTGASSRTAAGDPVTNVSVFETNDPFALTLAKAALEDAGIDYGVRGDGEIDRINHGGFPLWQLVIPDRSGAEFEVEPRRFGAA